MLSNFRTFVQKSLSNRFRNMVQSFELSNNFTIVQEFPKLVNPSVPTILGRFVSWFVEVAFLSKFLLFCVSVCSKSIQLEVLLFLVFIVLLVLLLLGFIVDSSENAFPARIDFPYCIKASKGFRYCYVFS